MKKNKLLIIFIVSIILLIGIIIGIIYFTTDIFKSNSELFWKYFSKVSNSTTELLSSKEQKMQNEFKQNNTYMSNGELLLSIKQGENSVKQLQIDTTKRHDVNNERTYLDAILKNGDLDIFNVSYINSGDIYAIKCDDVTPTYIGISNSNLQELATKYKLEFAEFIPNSINTTVFASLLDFTPEQENHIVDTYMPIIINDIPEKLYSKIQEQIKIEENTYNSNVYLLQLSGQNMKQILVDCLNNLKLDNETLVLLSNKFTSLQFGNDYTDITNLSTKITELIKKLEETDIQTEMYIKVYEVNGETIKVTVEITNVIKLEYDITDNKRKLVTDIININENQVFEDNINEESNEIIDLTPYEGNEEVENNVTRIIVERENLENSNLVKINLIPNTNNEDKNIYIEMNISNIQNNSFNNKFSLTANFDNNGKQQIITVSYDNKTTKTNEIEDIMELNSSNTVIANNYDTNQFKNFITNYYQIFMDKCTQKLKTLGFEVSI